MILGRGILSKIPIDICFYYNKMMLNGGAYAGCTTPMKDMEKSTPMHHLNGFRTNLFRNEYLWNSKQVLYTTRHMRRILDAHYENPT